MWVRVSGLVFLSLLAGCKTASVMQDVPASGSPIVYSSFGMAEPEGSFVNRVGTADQPGLAMAFVTEKGRFLPRTVLRIAELADGDLHLGNPKTELRSIILQAITNQGFLKWPIDPQYFNAKELTQSSSGSKRLKDGSMITYERFTANSSNCLGFLKDVSNVAFVNIRKGLLQGYYCLPSGEDFTEASTDEILNGVGVR